MWIVPGRVKARAAELWLAKLDEQPAGVVSLDLRRWGASPGTQVVNQPVQWRTTAYGDRQLSVARTWLTGLEPETRYDVVIGASLPMAPSGDDASFKTLPTRIGAVPGRGLHMILGSCFSPQRDGGRSIHAAGLNLRDRANWLPQIKVLCGDQVYLDIPVQEVFPSSEDRLREHLLAKYLVNWAPLGSRSTPAAFQGGGRMLRSGANLFVGDDHEYWNNSPFDQAHIGTTWTGSGRRRLLRTTRDLFRDFQSDYGPPGQERAHTRVVVGEDDAAPVEIFCLDGRYLRTERQAHGTADLQAVVAWLAGLRGPGILVLSQPLFDPPASSDTQRRFVDAVLADFDDYGTLTRALASAPHDVLTLSGDIHRGRIAFARAQNTIWEVVASPLTLLSPGSHGDAPPASLFPARPDGGPTRAVQQMGLLVRQDHYANLQLFRMGGRIAVTVTYHRTRGGTPGSLIGAPHTFQLE